jgi:type I restriction enzyme S subunit
LKDIEIDIPENFKTQVKIAKILSDLDAKIELNNRIIEVLESIVKMLYDYWFVQFDFPNNLGKPYKSSGGKMIFSKESKREIPEGWKVDRLGNSLKTVLGGTPSTQVSEYWKGNIHWLNSGEIANFPIIESQEHISEDAIDNSATTLMPAGSSLISITRHLRPSILAIDACANQSVVGILESKTIKSAYIYPYLINEIPRYMSLRTGAQQPHINKGTIDESIFLLPPVEILNNYYSKVEIFYKLIIDKSFESQTLKKLKDWLLPMLMNGQVTVGEVEEKLNMAAEQRIEYCKD